MFTLPETERDALLRNAFATAETPEAKQHFAFVLGILSDNTGVDLLAEEVETTPWDPGWDYTGMGQFGASMSPLDSRIIALGRCGASPHAELLARKAEKLPEHAEFSHYRALAEAFEALGQPSAVPALSSLLNRSGISGHHLHATRGRLNTITSDGNETSFRNRSLIELHLATALYSLDSDHPLGREILQAYSRDVRSIFASHAVNMLKTKTP